MFLRTSRSPEQVYRSLTVNPPLCSVASASPRTWLMVENLSFRSVETIWRRSTAA